MPFSTDQVSNDLARQASFFLGQGIKPTKKDRKKNKYSGEKDRKKHHIYHFPSLI